MDNELKKYVKAGRANLIVIYILFLCGVVAPLLPVIGVIFAYVNKDVTDQSLASHYIFIVRAFIGALLFICVNSIGVIMLPILSAYLLSNIINLCLYIWYILRVSIGLKYLLSYETHPNCMTWWIK